MKIHKTIYMSNTGSNIQVLLGADSFSDYLQLSQLTSSVSARDKKMIEDMVTVIKGLEAKKDEMQDALIKERCKGISTKTDKMTKIKSCLMSRCLSELLL